MFAPVVIHRILVFTAPPSVDFRLILLVPIPFVVQTKKKNNLMKNMFTSAP
jgi:hypothetical protein